MALAIIPIVHGAVVVGEDLGECLACGARGLFEVEQRDYDDQQEEAREGHEEDDQVLPIVSTDAVVHQ